MIFLVIAIQEFLFDRRRRQRQTGRAYLVGKRDGRVAIDGVGVN